MIFFYPFNPFVPTKQIDYRHNWFIYKLHAIRVYPERLRRRWEARKWRKRANKGLQALLWLDSMMRGSGTPRHYTRRFWRAFTAHKTQRERVYEELEAIIEELYQRRRL